MNEVFIDTNIFYNILFETSLTGKAKKLLEEYEENKLYTSLTAVNELLYISTRKYYQALGELKGAYNLRKLIASKGYPEFIANGIRKLLEDLEVEVLIENVEYQNMIETAS
ncbi:MAG: PIN domain-containing protein [Caldisphaeraceae archaeon]|nr:PIN domain-containing protein [Caldisphaeraceae archaeon]MEB3692022.1 PIN domain-containing protein [Caldisphaeraceae archaeon]